MTTVNHQKDAETNNNNSQPNKSVILHIPFTVFAPITVSLPLGSLIFCFVTAIIFQFDEVNKTVCQVQNVIPSISAITGVQPQRYIWRVCIALHCTPRFCVGFIYYNFYMEKLHLINKSQWTLYKAMVWLNFWIYTIENACLVGVTYIANVENYPLHEKIFVCFMITACVYECITIVLFRWCHPDPMPEHIAKSYKYKRIMFILILSFTAGLLFFFVRHRFYCEANAFSFFAFCEYGIAITNILFHFSAYIDFRGYKWHVVRPTFQDPVYQIEQTNGHTNITNGVSKKNR